MNSDSKKFEEILDNFEKIFSKIGIWPSKKSKPTKYIALSMFVTFWMLLVIKVIRNPERDSIENGVVNGFGCILTASFLIRLIVSEEKFNQVLDFIREDLKKIRSEHKIMLEKVVKEMQILIKFVVYVLPAAVIPKLLFPFLGYGYAVFIQKDKNATLFLPPQMAFPPMPFLFYDNVIIYILECVIRIAPLCYLMTAALFFAISSLYIGGCFRGLAMELENFSIDDDDAFEECIKRHDEIINIANMLNSLYDLHFFAECIVAYINTAALLFSMFVENRGILSILNDVVLMQAGASQFVFINLFGEKLMEASLTVFNGAYNSDWIGKSVKQQKKLIFMMIRARKPTKLCVTEDFVTASLEFMTNLLRHSYAMFNILKTSIKM